MISSKVYAESEVVLCIMSRDMREDMIRYIKSKIL